MLVLQAIVGAVDGSNRKFKTVETYVVGTLWPGVNGQIKKPEDDDGVLTDQGAMTQEERDFLLENSTKGFILKIAPKVGATVEAVYDNGQNIVPFPVKELTGTISGEFATIGNRIEVSRGNSITLPIFISDDKGNAVPLTNTAARFFVKASETVSDDNALIAKSSSNPAEILYTDPSNGRIEVFISTTDTSSLTVWGKYVYELRLTFITGESFSPITGVIRITA